MKCDVHSLTIHFSAVSQAGRESILSAAMKSRAVHLDTGVRWAETSYTAASFCVFYSSRVVRLLRSSIILRYTSS